MRCAAAPSPDRSTRTRSTPSNSSSCASRWRPEARAPGRALPCRPGALSQALHPAFTAVTPTRRPPAAVLRLSLVPRDREFFDLFEEAGKNIERAADLLDQMLRNWPESKELAREILICEQEGDRITHDVIQRLHQTFVTPIDREDIYELASALDDIVDYTEEVADYLGLYSIEAPMEQAMRLSH